MPEPESADQIEVLVEPEVLSKIAESQEPHDAEYAARKNCDKATEERKGPDQSVAAVCLSLGGRLMTGSVSTTQGSNAQGQSWQGVNIEQICSELQKYNGKDSEAFRNAVQRAVAILENQEVRAAAQRVISSGSAGASGGSAMSAGASNRGPTSG